MRNFNKGSVDEFRCRCGKCGKGIEDMEPIMLMSLDDARDLARVPFVLNSAIRCYRWNKQCRGSEDSAHLKGWAIDIKATDSRTRYRVLKALLACGFHRIGIYKTFIHADMDPSLPPEVTWVK